MGVVAAYFVGNEYDELGHDELMDINNLCLAVVASWVQLAVLDAGPDSIGVLIYRLKTYMYVVERIGQCRRPLTADAVCGCSCG